MGLKIWVLGMTLTAICHLFFNEPGVVIAGLVVASIGAILFLFDK